MAGIYIHIPFCKQACYYCNFHFSTSLALKDEIVNSLISEIHIRGNSHEEEIAIISKEEIIETIYFGGGTPSMLNTKEILQILSAIDEQYTVADNAEITLEANPDDINLEKLRQWRSIGINRLSIGIQSFRENDLKWMNRAHDATQAIECISLARQAEFDNFSIDLIFGIPGLSNADWENNVRTVIELEVPHVAGYALTVEPKTALQKMIALKKKENVNSDEQAAQYMILMQMMQNAGYEHYEISNFAKPGYRSQHNSSYWQGKKYIGIGPSAHSFNGKMRMWNKANNIYYHRSVLQKIIPFEKEILSISGQLDEYIMISLRTIEGMSLSYIEAHFSKEDRVRIEQILLSQLIPGQFIQKEDHIILTREGKLLADAISVKLFS